MNMAQRIELKLELESSRGAGCEGCEVESVAKLPLWHSQTVHLSACSPAVRLSSPVFIFNTRQAKNADMVRTRGRTSGAGQCGVGRAQQLRYLYELQATYIPSSSCYCSCSSSYSRSTCCCCSSRCSLAAALFCSALLYAPFPFPLSTCWVFSVCPAQLSHPSPCLPFPLCTPFSLVIVVLLFSACTAAVVAVIWIVGLRYSR